MPAQGPAIDGTTALPSLTDASGNRGDDDVIADVGMTGRSTPHGTPCAGCGR